MIALDPGASARVVETVRSNVSVPVSAKLSPNAPRHRCRGAVGKGSRRRLGGPDQHGVGSGNRHRDLPAAAVDHHGRLLGPASQTHRAEVRGRGGGRPARASHRGMRGSHEGRRRSRIPDGRCLRGRYRHGTLRGAPRRTAYRPGTGPVVPDPRGGQALRACRRCGIESIWACCYRATKSPRLRQLNVYSD